MIFDFLSTFTAHRTGSIMAVDFRDPETGGVLCGHAVVCINRATDSAGFSCAIRGCHISDKKSSHRLNAKMLLLATVINIGISSQSFSA